jgi:hypothetical protein
MTLVHICIERQSRARAPTRVGAEPTETQNVTTKQNPYFGRHPMTTLTRVLHAAIEAHLRLSRPILAKLQDLWDSDAQDVGIGDVLNGTPLRRTRAPAMWRPGDTKKAA